MYIYIYSFMMEWRVLAEKTRLVDMCWKLEVYICIKNRDRPFCSMTCTLG